MNKKILAAAIAASIAAPMAVAADVTIFGKLHESVDFVDQSTGGTTTTDNDQLTSRASRIGFKGSEDLGNGLKANFSMEFQYNMDQSYDARVNSVAGATTNTGASSAAVQWSQRNTWMGISGDFGEFRMGRHDTPAKVAMYAGGIEQLGDSIADVNRAIDNSSLVNSGSGLNVMEEVRASNALAYISPNMSGFQVAIAGVAGEQSGQTATTGNDGLADSYSIGGWYGNGPLKVSASYESLANANSSLPEQDTWGIYGSYSMDAFSVMAGYQDTSDYGNVASTDKEAWIIGAAFTTGNNKIFANYGDVEVDATGTANDVDGDTWSIGAQHMFSKRTSAYVAYTDSETDAAGTANDTDGDTFSLGMVHSF